MIKILIQSISFQPKFPCSLSIIAKIQNQQFIILKELPFKQKNMQDSHIFPLDSVIQLQKGINMFQNSPKMELNILLTTSSGKVKLISIKKNLNQKYLKGKTQEQKFVNCPDKNAKIVFSLHFSKSNLKASKIQYKTPKQNNKIVNNYALKKGYMSYKAFNYNNSFTDIKQPSQQLTKTIHFERKKSNSFQRKQYVQNEKIDEQVYCKNYLQTKDKMQVMSRKLIKLQENSSNVQAELKNFILQKTKLQEINRKLVNQVKEHKQLLSFQEAQVKKIQKIMIRNQRQSHRKIQNQIHQNQKLKFKQSILKDQLKSLNQLLYRVSNQKEDKERQIQRLNQQLAKKSHMIFQNDIKKQYRIKQLTTQINKLVQKSKDLQRQNCKLKNQKVIMIQRQKENQQILHQKNRKNKIQLDNERKNSKINIQKLNSIQQRLKGTQKDLGDRLAQIQKSYQASKEQIKQQQKKNELLISINHNLQIQIQDCKTKLQVEEKGKFEILLQKKKIEEAQSEKMIKFNLAQLQEYHKMQQQNFQLQRQVKKLSKSVNKLKQSNNNFQTTIKKNTFSTQSQTHFSGMSILKQSGLYAKHETKEKLIKLSQITLNNKIKEFQSQKKVIVKRYEQKQKQIMQKKKQIQIKFYKISKKLDEARFQISQKCQIITRFMIERQKEKIVVEQMTRIVKQLNNYEIEAFSKQIPLLYQKLIQLQKHYKDLNQENQETQVNKSSQIMKEQNLKPIKKAKIIKQRGLKTEKILNFLKISNRQNMNKSQHILKSNENSFCLSNSFLSCQIQNQLLLLQNQEVFNN